MAIKLSDLSKRYGSNDAVRGVSLEVEQGELFGFLGPNGAGKTTTIKMLTGLLEPSSGIAEIKGINIWTSPIEAKKHLARSEEHTSELQSRGHLVCRLLLEKKNLTTPQEVE